MQRRVLQADASQGKCALVSGSWLLTRSIVGHYREPPSPFHTASGGTQPLRLCPHCDWGKQGEKQVAEIAKLERLQLMVYDTPSATHGAEHIGD